MEEKSNYQEYSQMDGWLDRWADSQVSSWTDELGEGKDSQMDVMVVI
jgi:hypothetical protein